MTVLLIPLIGPMQTWSLSGPYRDRATADVPTKSGVTGLLAAALGRARDADVHDLAALRLHVRVDAPGSRLRDFQTAGRPLRANGTVSSDVILTRREYLTDAAFLAAVEATTPAEEALLAHLHAALAHPVFPLYLGRRNCLPARPLHDPTGLRDHGPEEAFRSAPALTGGAGLRRAYYEDPAGPLMIRDQPTRGEAVPGRTRHPGWTERYATTAWVHAPAPLEGPQ